jgi:NADP-dependent 3-hydroxy acid dehydrogenase YdfG
MGKLIVITGASSGFGAEMAKLFDQAGYKTLLLARRIELIEKMNLKHALIKKLDVTDFDSFQKIVFAAEKQVGPIDLIVNNAGVMKLGIMGVQNRPEYQRMINVNISGVINGIEAVINSMKKRKSGTIINIASTAGIKSYPEHAVYCGTKSAVRAITETLRQEVAEDNIRVSSVCPGAFSTELLSHTSDEKIITNYET